VNNDAAPWLAEGLATSLEPSMLTFSDIADLSASLFTVTRAEELSYVLSGDFVRWLFDRDPAALRFLYENIPVGLDPAEQEELLHGAYGLPFAELEAKFWEELPVRYVPFRQCADLEELPWTDGEVVFAGELDCSKTHTRGPYSASPISALYDKTYRSFLIRVPQAGRYSVDVVGAQAGELSRCATKHPATIEERSIEMASHLIFSDYLVEGQIIDVELEAGDWRLDIREEHGPAEPIGFHMWPADE
jgi:hypothetical protein